MVAVPFIYFSILAWILWRQSRTFGIASLMAGLYAISGFFSILIDANDLYGVNVIASPDDVTLFPTLLYCVLITLLILPFQKVAQNPPRQIVLKDERFFNFLCFAYMALLLVTVLLMFRGVSTVLHGDLHAMKIDSRTPDGVAARTRQSGGAVVFLLGYFADFSFFMLPFFFFSLCFLQRHFLFNLLLFCTTLMRVFISLLTVDRSRPLFWIYMAAFSLLFFRPYFSRKQKRVLFIAGSILAYFLVAYFVAVTIARFHFRSAGTSGGFISYGGQSFLYFCNHFHKYPPVYSFYRIFPLLYSPILPNGESLEFHYFLQTGMTTGIFTSVLGVFYADLGLVGMISMVLFLHFLFKFALNRIAKRDMNFSGVLLMYAMAIIPLWGNISYWYNVRQRMLTLVLCLLVVCRMYFKERNSRSQARIAP